MSNFTMKLYVISKWFLCNIYKENNCILTCQKLDTLWERNISICQILYTYFLHCCIFPFWYGDCLIYLLYILSIILYLCMIHYLFIACQSISCYFIFVYSTYQMYIKSKFCFYTQSSACLQCLEGLKLREPTIFPLCTITLT